MKARGRARALFGEGGEDRVQRAGPEPERERRSTDTRAEPGPPARGGSAGGEQAAVTYFLRLRSGQPERLDR